MPSHILLQGYMKCHLIYPWSNEMAFLNIRLADCINDTEWQDITSRILKHLLMFLFRLLYDVFELINNHILWVKYIIYKIFENFNIYYL